MEVLKEFWNKYKGAIIGAIKSSSDYKKDQEEIEREYDYA